MKNILSKYELNVKNDWLIVQCQHNFFFCNFNCTYTSYTCTYNK